jgi:hypothetical protein
MTTCRPVGGKYLCVGRVKTPDSVNCEKYSLYLSLARPFSLCDIDKLAFAICSGRVGT